MKQTFASAHRSQLETDSPLSTTATVLLNWRAFHRTKGTEHAVSSIRTQQRLAIDAFVEKLAGIGPHGSQLRNTTVLTNSDFRPIGFDAKFHF